MPLPSSAISGAAWSASRRTRAGADVAVPRAHVELPGLGVPRHPQVTIRPPGVLDEDPATLHDLKCAASGAGALEVAAGARSR